MWLEVLLLLSAKDVHVCMALSSFQDGAVPTRPPASIWNHNHRRARLRHLTDHPPCICGAGKLDKLTNMYVGTVVSHAMFYILCQGYFVSLRCGSQGESRPGGCKHTHSMCLNQSLCLSTCISFTLPPLSSLHVNSL